MVSFNDPIKRLLRFVLFYIRSLVAKIEISNN